MSLGSTVKEFLLASDIHGVRFWNDPRLSVGRRFLWLLMFLASLYGLGHQTYTRLQHFYSYPTSTDVTIEYENVPLPGIAICPKYESPIIPLPQPLTGKHISSLSDADVVYLITSDVNGGAALIVEHQRTDGRKYQLNRTMMQFIKSLRLGLHQINDTEATIEGIKHKIGLKIPDQYLFEYYYLTVLQRLQTVNMTLSLDVISEFPAFIQKFGVKIEHVETCALKTESLSIDNCASFMTNIFIDETSCLALVDINGSDIYLTNHGKGSGDTLYLTLTDKAMEGVFIYLYDKNEIPSGTYKFLQYKIDPVVNSKPVILTLAEVMSYNVLGTPYGRACSRSGRSQCIQECLVREHGCMPYYMSTDKLAITSQPCHPGYILNYTPHCPHECGASCNLTEYTIHETKDERRYRFALIITADRKSKFITYTQSATYLAGDLIADIGGVSGLFIGASFLTFYHCIEFIFLLIPRGLKYG